jgi:hypothetical protein
LRPAEVKDWILPVSSVKDVVTVYCDARAPLLNPASQVIPRVFKFLTSVFSLTPNGVLGKIHG